jgi:hypothetical protein
VLDHPNQGYGTLNAAVQASDLRARGLTIDEEQTADGGTIYSTSGPDAFADDEWQAILDWSRILREAFLRRGATEPEGGEIQGPSR